MTIVIRLGQWPEVPLHGSLPLPCLASSSSLGHSLEMGPHHPAQTLTPCSGPLHRSQHYTLLTPPKDLMSRLTFRKGKQPVLKVLKNSFYYNKLMRATILHVVSSNSLSKASRKPSSITWHSTSSVASPRSSPVSARLLALPFGSHHSLKEPDRDSPLTESFPTPCTHLWSHFVPSFFSPSIYITLITHV